jgi:hypothetical protein
MVSIAEAERIRAKWLSESRIDGVTRLHGLSRCTAFKNKTKFSVQGKKKLI